MFLTLMRAWRRYQELYGPITDIIGHQTDHPDSIIIRLEENTLKEIEHEAGKREISKSEVIREWFCKRKEL